MANWLDKLLPPPPPKTGAGRQLVKSERKVALPSLFKNINHEKVEEIPNASLIYGLASAALVVLALYFLFTGTWSTALLLFILAASLFGFALYYLRVLK